MKTDVQIVPGLIASLDLRSVFSADGYPQWSGKVVFTIDDTIDDTQSVVTANWSGEDHSKAGKLCDFEGNLPAGDPVYATCETFAADWSEIISASLSYPSAFEAHANDLVDPDFEKDHEPMKAV